MAETIISIALGVSFCALVTFGLFAIPGTERPRRPEYPPNPPVPPGHK